MESTIEIILSHYKKAPKQNYTRDPEFLMEKKLVLPERTDETPQKFFYNKNHIYTELIRFMDMVHDMKIPMFITSKLNSDHQAFINNLQELADIHNQYQTN
ncbi:hypothetical protein GF367_00240 [Candidatus Woesearchaeota archaeon]|nr:hypothetical protein [Candidatus Woesearchaeota archaeon]